MALVYNPNTITSGYNPTSINANHTQLVTLLANAVNRNGGANNEMLVDFDLGNNDLLNGGVINCDDLTIGGISVAAQAAAADASATAAAGSAAAAAASAIAAAGSETNAASSATLASQWATQLTTLVAATDYSSKEYAMGATAQSSKRYANELVTNLDGAGSYSAKEYAVGTTAPEGTSKQWAIQTSGLVRAIDYSSKAWAMSSLMRGIANGGSAKDWAILTGATADDTEYSAKEYAIGTTVAAGSAKDWAIQAEDSLVDGVGYSAYHWAQKAATIVGARVIEISVNDATQDYISNKLTAIHGLTWTEINDGGDEDFQISIGSHLEIGGGANNYSHNVYKADSGNSFSHYTNLTTGNTSADGLRIGLNAAEQVELWNYENTDMIFGVNNLSKMVLHPSGYLDLGPNSMNINTINANVAGSGANYIGFTNDTTGHTAGDGAVVGISASEDALIWNYEVTNLIFATSSIERMRILAGGNVSIGTTTDANKLQVHGGGDSYIGITNTDTGSTSADGAKIGITATENLRIDIQETGKEIEFATQGTVDWAMAADGGMYSTNATGGTQGAETMNTKGYFVNGKRTPALLGNYTGTAAASLNLANIFSSNTAYKTFKVTGWITANTAAATIRSRVSTDGSTFVTTASYGYTVRVWRSNGTATNTQANPSVATTMEMCDGTGLDVGTDNYSFEITWNGPASTSVITAWHGLANYIINGGTVSNIAYIGGTYDSATAVTGFQIYPSTGNFDYDISVWGIS